MKPLNQIKQQNQTIKRLSDPRRPGFLRVTPIDPGQQIAQCAGEIVTDPPATDGQMNLLSRVFFVNRHAPWPRA